MIGKKVFASPGQAESYRALQKEKEFGESIFRTMQLCWWYVMYAPEYSTNLGESEAKTFSNRLNKVYDELIEHDMGENMVMVKNDTGIDPAQEARNIPYSLAVKIYNKKLYGNEAKRFIFQFRRASEEVFMIVAYALLHDYHMTKEMIEMRFDEFREFIKLFGKGLKPSHIEEYFISVEGIPIIN